MNSARRKALRKIIAQIEDLKGELEALCGEERDYYDNMPESFQDSEKGTKADEAASSLEEAADELDNVISSIGEAIG